MREKGILVLLGALALAGCEAGEEAGVERDVREQAPYEELAATADTSQGYSTGAAAPVTPVQGGTRIGGPLTATGQFQGVGQNPPPGSVTLTQVEGGTRMSVLVNGYTANARLRVSIVRGSCDAPGQVVHAVPQPVQTDPGGAATLEAVVPAPTEQLLDGSHAVLLSVGQGSGGTVGCAAIGNAR